MTKDVFPVDDFSRLIQNWAINKLKYASLPSLSFVVTHKGEVVYQNAFGLADVENHVAATIDTTYRVASLTKSLTATAIMQLVEAEQLGLDQQVQAILPWFGPNDTNASRVTVRQLLSHAGGVVRDGSSAGWANDDFPSVETFAKSLQENVTYFEPNETFKYSNVGYNLLGQVVAAVSLMSYEYYVQQSILQPLEMTHSTFALNEKDLVSLAVPYGRLIPGQKREQHTPFDAGAFNPSAGLISTPSDVMKFLLAHRVGNGLLLSDDVKREMIKPQMKTHGDEFYGLGFDVDPSPLSGIIVGHTGGAPGYSARMARDISSEIGVAVATNASEGGASNLLVTILRLAKKCSDAGESTDASLETRKLEGLWEGRFGVEQTAVLGDELVVLSPNGLNPFAEGTELAQTGPTTFKTVNDSPYNARGEDITFSTNEAGGATEMQWASLPFFRA